MINEPNEEFSNSIEEVEACDENGWAKRLSLDELDRLAFAAEHPDLVDPLIKSLPERRLNYKTEARLRKQMKEELGRAHQRCAQLIVLTQRGQIQLTPWVS
ncbi:MAG: hypothetical protein KC964_11335 [Candidatus Omnitrophica bacterium]|nr:hypothetical protein [Candidatus Omnitrophota bacterium]